MEFVLACFPGEIQLEAHPLDREFWQLLVYCSDQALGNPTGVVFSEAALSSAEYLRMAASLGYPDTVFLTPTTDPALWKARAFSPTEELSMCTQGLIAAFRVIQQKSRSAVLTAARFVTPSSTVEVNSSGRAGLAWLSAPYRILGPGTPPEFLPPAERSLLVDTGRVRLVREFAEVTELEGFRLAPDAVFAFCREHGISGLCLFSRCGPENIRLRVFTTSLDGREDASTGGAAMAIIPALLAWRALLPDEGSKVWTIQQGLGPGHRRGTLNTAWFPASLERV